MSPRRAKRRDDEPPPLRVGSGGGIETHADGEWMVRRVGGEVSPKLYRCPGCDQEIHPGLPHVVAWRPGAEADRRHWHSPCWAARLRRSAAVRRGRGPRY